MRRPARRPYISRRWIDPGDDSADGILYFMEQGLCPWRIDPHFNPTPGKIWANVVTLAKILHGVGPSQGVLIAYGRSISLVPYARKSGPTPSPQWTRIQCHGQEIYLIPLPDSTTWDSINRSFNFHLKWDSKSGEVLGCAQPGSALEFCVWGEGVTAALRCLCLRSEFISKVWPMYKKTAAYIV